MAYCGAGSGNRCSEPKESDNRITFSVLSGIGGVCVIGGAYLAFYKWNFSDGLANVGVLVAVCLTLMFLIEAVPGQRWKLNYGSNSIISIMLCIVSGITVILSGYYLYSSYANSSLAQPEQPPTGYKIMRTVPGLVRIKPGDPLYNAELFDEPPKNFML